MTGPILLQLDYIYFFSCLSFVLAGIAALILGRTRPGEADWPLLSLSWFFAAANKLLLLVSRFLYHSEPLYYLSLVFLAGSFLFLLAFSQRTARRAGVELFSAYFYYFPVLSAALGIFLSGGNAEMLVRYFFGVPSALLAAYVLWALVPLRLSGLKYLSAVFAGFFLVQGLVVPDPGHLQSFVFSESLFLALFGFPVQLARALLALAAAWLTLNYCQKAVEDNSRQKGHPYPARSWVFYRSLAVFLAVLIIGWLATGYFGQRQKRLVENRAASDAKLVVDLLSESMRTADRAVKAMAGSPWIGPLLEKRTGPRNDEANSVLDRYNSSFGLSVCYLMDDKGVVIAASNRKQPDSFMGRDFSFRPYFKNAIAGEPSSYLAVGIVSGKRGYYSSAPVLSEGRPAGVVTAKKDIEELESVLNPSSAVLLVDSDGIIFLSDEKDLIFRPLWPIESFAAGSRVKDLQYRHVLTEPVLEKRPSSGDLTEFKGSPVLVNSSAASVSGWMLYTLYPAGSIQTSRATAMLITAACAVLAMGLLYFINDRELRLLETTLDKEQLAITLQSVGDGLITTDDLGRIAMANEAALYMLGLRLEEVMGRHIEEVMKIVEESSRTPIENPVLEVLRTRKQVKLKNHALLIAADGRELNISDSASPIIMGTSGVFLGVVLVFRDVSLRIQGENRLRLAAQEWEKTFDNMAEGITVQDSGFIITNANRTACRILGIRKEDLIGKKCYEVFHKTDSPLASCPMVRSLASKGSEEADIFEKSLGRWFRISTTPVFDASGGIEKVVHIMQDITERKRAEEKLREYAELQKTVISNLQGVIFSLDSNGIFTLSDGKGLAELGLDPGQMVGRSVFDVYRDVPEITEGMRKALEGHLWTGTVRVQGIMFDTFASPVIGSDGRVEGVTGIATDITQRTKNEELIKELNEQQRTILDSTPAMIFYKDMENRFVRVNETMARVSGYSKQDMEGRSLWELFTKEDADRYWKDDKEVMDSGMPKYGIVEKMNTKQGTLWVQTDKIPYKDPKGNIIGVIGFTLDITQRKLQEEKIREAQDSLEATLDAIPDPLFEAGLDGTYYAAHSPRQELLAAPAQDLVGKKVFDVMPQEAAEVCIAALKEANEKGFSHGREFELTLPQGSRWFELSVSRKASAAGEAPHFIVLSRDITERKHVESELKQLSDLKTEFVATVSHELRTPLTIIKEGTALISDQVYGKLEEKQSRILNMVKENIRNLEKLISDLLDISRIESKKQEVNPVEFDICAVMQELLEQLSVKAAEKKVEIEAECPFEGGLMVFSDRDKFRQIVTNLITNAINYNREGGKVHVSGADEGQFLRIEISDTGPGIKEEDMEHLFEKFRQFGRVPGSGPKGTGLGLSITKALVELHGGRIWAQSKYGEGTKFVFTLPKHYNEEQKGAV